MRRWGLLAAALVWTFGCGDPAPAGNDGGTDSGVASECAGKVDGFPCGDATANTCDAADTCQMGACVPNFAAAGTVCGDAVGGACDASDTCDGQGLCQPQFQPDGTACGDPTESACDHADTCLQGACVTNLAAAGTGCGDATATDCDQADTCDGAGACLSNVVTDGMSCGDATATECDAPDTCLAGVCAPNPVAAGTACGDTTSTDCTAPDTCDGAGDCAPNDLLDGTACGDPASSDCNAADTCAAGVCAENLAVEGAPCGNTTDAQCDHADSCDGAGACLGNVELDGVACTDCAAGVGHCELCVAGACPDFACSSVGASLSTTFAAGNNHRGSMFDVDAAAAVVISQVTINPLSVGTIPVEVYTTPNGIAGKETSPAGWRLVASVSVTVSAAGPVVLPVSLNVPLAAGSTTGFYVTSANTAYALSYSNGTAFGAVAASDSMLTIHEGHGLEYPFTAGTGQLFTPRVWNGTLGYALPATLATPGSGAIVAEGQMFDVTALQDTHLNGLDLKLAMGAHDVDVWFRPGSHAGFENDPSAWLPLASVIGLTGGGAPAHVGFTNSLDLPAGATWALYVDTATTGGALQVEAATGSGAPTASDTRLEIAEGVSVTHAFGGTGAASAFNGAVTYNPCQ